MILSTILLLFFLAIIVFQVYRFKQLVVSEKKTLGVYIAGGLGAFVILGVTFYFGQNILHTITGISGALALIGSLHVTGLTADSFVYSTVNRRMIGQKVPFRQSENIRVETIHGEKVIIRFVSYKSERLMIFSKEDEPKVKDVLAHHITNII